MEQRELRSHSLVPLSCERTISWNDGSGRARFLYSPIKRQLVGGEGATDCRLPVPTGLNVVLAGENLAKEKTGTMRCRRNLLKRPGLLASGSFGGAKLALSGGGHLGVPGLTNWAPTQRLQERQAGVCCCLARSL